MPADAANQGTGNNGSTGGGSGAGSGASGGAGAGAGQGGGAGAGAGGSGQGGAQGGAGAAGGAGSGAGASGANGGGKEGAASSSATGAGAGDKSGASGGDKKGGEGEGGQGAGEWGAEGEAHKDDKGKGEQKKEGEGGEYKLEVAQELSEYVTPESLDAFTKFAQAEKIPLEMANKLVKYSAEQAKASREEARAFMREQSQGWFSEIKADKELGGANFEATKTSINRALQHSGQAGLHAKLTEFGINNFPPLVRFMKAYGDLLEPDSGRLPGGKGGSGTETLEQMQHRWYVTDAK